MATTKYKDAVDILTDKKSGKDTVNRFIDRTYLLSGNSYILEANNIEVREARAYKVLGEILSQGPIKPININSKQQLDNLAISFEVERNETPEGQRAFEQTQEFRKLVKDAGIIELDKETIATEGLSEYLPKGFSPHQLTLALNLYANGVPSSQIEKSLDNTLDIYKLNESQKNSLYAVPSLVAMFEETDLGGYSRDLTKNLQTAFKTKVYAHEVKEGTKSNDQTFVFTKVENTFLPDTDWLKAKAGDIAIKARQALTKPIANAIKKGVTGLIKKGAAKLLAKAGVEIAAQAIGSLAPGVGNVIAKAVSFIVTEVLPRIAKYVGKLVPGFVKDFIRRHSKDFAMTSIFFLGAGILLQNTVLIGLGLINAVFGIGAFTAAISALIGLIVVPLVVLPLATLAAYLLAIILTVAFAIVIINNSAYISPYNPDPISDPQYPSESPYISIIKTPDPRGPFENNTEITVTYTITITARQGSLTDISFSSTCQVLQETPTASGCPDEENITVNYGLEPVPTDWVPPDPPPPDPPSFPIAEFPPPAPGVITPSLPYIITYTQTFNVGGSGTYNDSSITDTFVINASAADGTSTSARASASITIGTPPTGCFSLIDNKDPWPANYYSAMLAAISYLRSNHASYATKVCSAGTVNICFNNVDSDYWGYHNHTSSCDITFYQGSYIYTITNSSFILAHEAAHHLASGNVRQDLYLQYQNYCSPSGSCISQEGNICSYPFTKSSFENFAEAIGVYVNTPSYWASYCGSSLSFRERYPIHYEFVDQYIFQ